MYYIAALMVSILDALIVIPLSLSFLLIGARMYTDEWKSRLRKDKTDRGSDD